MAPLSSSQEVINSAAQGKDYWRSLEELVDTEEFRQYLYREFPENAQEWNDPVGRRQFLKLMGASLALAGLSACTRQPTETIVPYVQPPEYIVPGRPLFFATATSISGIADGLLVESHMGRPTKVEGNPDHPSSRGATDAFAQASVLTLYDPDRSQTLTYLGEIRPWTAFLGEIQSVMADKRATQGAGLRILTETVGSPTLAAQLRALLTEFPAAKWHQYEPVNRDNARAGARLAFGRDVNTIYRFEAAEVVLALDCDFLACGPGNLRYARDFAAKRRIVAGNTGMNRLYVVESALTGTGAKADHRLALRSGEIEGLARAVAAALGAPVASTYTAHANWVGALARDLQRHRGKSIIIAGDSQPPIVHALAHAMNQMLGNVGNTVVYTDPVEANTADHTESLRQLAGDMEAGAVDMLVIVGGNPVYTAPADLNFRELISKVRLRIHLSLYNDETSELCHWHIPEAHYLETWSDARAYDGTVSIIQPLIAPLYRGKSAHELLAAFTSQPERSGYDIVRDYWRSRNSSGDFEQFWRKALHDGLVPNTVLPAISVNVNMSAIAAQPPAALGSGQGAMEIVFKPDPTIYDGRFANNGWLQELPKPLTKLTWDNAALIAPNTAIRLGLASAGRPEEANEKVVELNYQGRAVQAPILVMPGHAEDSVTVHLGYGRWRAGRVGSGQGFNAYAIRASTAPWFGSGLEIRPTGHRYPLAITQQHHMLEGRNHVRAATLEQYRQDPEFAHKMAHAPEGSLYPDYQYPGYAWGMAIDQMACVGCNACVVACQAENNIPIVGKAQVLNNREMHWLRIDTYYKGDPGKPETIEAYFQPMLCQHCEKAPCEVVCPVAATVHDSEGLNNMIYNRCVGTRYCSNNCPYKVRRFNFLQYVDWDTPSLKLMRNPDVTVRSRGVMEKCTYCVQRIAYARIEAEKEGREIRDGEIVTACQAACPTEAIVFGNINDKNSRVARLRAEPRNYGVLAELNTRPRTTYLAAVRNPNQEIEKA